MKAINYLQRANGPWLKVSIAFLTFLLFLIFPSCQKDEFDQDPTLDIEGISSFAKSEKVKIIKGKVKDIEGNVYKTVKIGKQWWMAENLKTTMYNDGTPIPFVNDNQVWQNTSTAAYCWYDNNEITYKDTYGALYNWFTVETGKLCPKGWHVPSDAEWKILEMYLGMTQEEADSEGTSRGDVGGKLKEAGLVHWQDPNYGATNETGFTALPGGNHEFGGEFSAMDLMCQMWSSTPFIGTPDAWQRFVSYGEATVGRDHPCKADGKSVRCVKDAP